MGRQGFHRWAWLVVLGLGGLLMLYGGAQDVAIFFSSDLAPVPSWHPVLPLVGLVCGLIVLASAGLNVVWGWQLRGSRQWRGDDRRLDQWLLWLWQPDGSAGRRLVDDETPEWMNKSAA
jgi:hypothetical protein